MRVLNIYFQLFLNFFKSQKLFLFISEIDNRHSNTFTVELSSESKKLKSQLVKLLIADKLENFQIAENDDQLVNKSWKLNLIYALDFHASLCLIIVARKAYRNLSSVRGLPRKRRVGCSRTGNAEEEKR